MSFLETLKSDATAAEKFLIDAEALIAKYLPVMTGVADAAEAATGNVELIPITNGVSGAAETALTAATAAQDGQLATAVSGIATAVSQAKTAIAATHQVAAPAPAAASGS